MRRPVFLLISALLLATPAYSAQTDSPGHFTGYMHEIYKSYRNALLSAQKLNFDTADIHLRHLQDYIREVPRYVPAETERGVKISKAAFLKRLGGFDKKVSHLRKTVNRVDLSAMEGLRSDLFTICVDCHKESKLPYLFRFPEHKTVFEDYMHGIWENYRMAREYLDKGDALRAEESLKIINQYLDLLKDTYPEKGPSGVVMDRNRLNGEIRTTQGISGVIQMDLHDKQSGDFAPLVKQLNDICVACHEPDRIK